VENMEERQVEKGVFLLYFPYLFTIQLLSLTIVKISLKILIGEKINKKLKKIIK
jgi:hypothetical protein